MITLQDIANLFGGTIPVWFWVVAGIVLLVLLFVVGGNSKSSGGYEKGDIKIARNSDGTYYAYDKTDGRVLYTAASKADVAQYVSSQLNR